MDKRYTILKERLYLLSNSELYRIIRDIDRVCFDTFNYDKSSNTYCPLGIALNLHREILEEPPTNKFIKELIANDGRFFPVNVIGGVEGNFYTEDHRREDLLNVILEIFAERDEKEKQELSNIY